MRSPMEVPGGFLRRDHFRGHHWLKKLGVGELHLHLEGSRRSGLEGHRVRVLLVKGAARSVTSMFTRRCSATSPRSTYVINPSCTCRESFWHLPRVTLPTNCID